MKIPYISSAFSLHLGESFPQKHKYKPSVEIIIELVIHYKNAANILE
jgi:hypothetical protein